MHGGMADSAMAGADLTAADSRQGGVRERKKLESCRRREQEEIVEREKNGAP
jgi:hypothetical protein